MKTVKSKIGSGDKSLLLPDLCKRLDFIQRGARVAMFRAPGGISSHVLKSLATADRTVFLTKLGEIITAVASAA